MFKKYIQQKLENYVKQYFKAHPEVKLVVVAGSVGKTSTKTAIATVLSYRYRVRLHEGNHNTGMSAPLAILGIEYPGNIKSIGAWISVFRAAKKRIKDPADVDVIIQELGVDHVGDMAAFGSYLRPDIAVVTAVTPEHMEFFGTIEAVAQEELSVANFSSLVLINRDDIEGRFASFITNPSLDTYGTTAAAEYRFEIDEFMLYKGYKGRLFAPEFQTPVEATLRVVGEHSLRPAIAAMTVATKIGMLPADIAAGMSQVRAVPGRMSVLRGMQGSTIIDDSYNSSPAAASAALQTLYGIDAAQRIAVLGSMNELGALSADEHKKLGALCDPNLLAWVITIGEEAEMHLAPAARARGCQVKSFRSAIEAGAFLHSVLDDGAVVLVKGSQGGIYAEEALKVILHDTEDDRHLVRQSPAWIATKQTFFSQFSK
jgi:UDP-N-acetylmuramoyl-tripeptide--D-alanyl-D-alanine ligase